MTASRIAAAIAVPVVVFVALHTLAVRPQRGALLRAQQRLEQLRTKAVQAHARAPKGGRFSEPAKVIETLVNGTAIGGVNDLSIRTSREEMTVVFTARHDQIGRFFWSLSALPIVFDVRSVQLTSSPSGFVQATIKLVPGSGNGSAAVPAGAEPQWKRNPFAPVTSEPQ